MGCIQKKKNCSASFTRNYSFLVQLSVPLGVDECNYAEHFQAQRNAAPHLFKASAVLLLFLLYSSQLPDCTENHSSTTTVAMATRGEIHFISLFVTLPPSVPPLSLLLSFPPSHYFLYLSVPSLVILLSSCLSQTTDRQQRMQRLPQ